ncbi:MAG: hypothetical protein HY505_01755 [Candidatus Yanofskybacteria bacterium]|nr:hypothetical protein [Candidatus Yanofskybacteria bacterium]
MGEIKEFKPKPLDATRGKPEKPADVVDIETARQKKQEKTPFSFPDTESEELMDTISGLVQKVFAESRNKKQVVAELRKLTEDLKRQLKE